MKKCNGESVQYLKQTEIKTETKVKLLKAVYRQILIYGRKTWAVNKIKKRNQAERQSI